jgi:hypothetical protein
MNDGEYRRRRRVIGWMLTAHAALRDRYTRRSRGLTLIVMVLSIIGLLLALANGDQQVSVLSIDGKLQVFLAWLAALTFFVSLVDLVVDWRRRALSHQDGARRLGELSVLYGRAVEENGEWVVEGIDLTTEYQRTMGAIDPIPDKKAAAMKALDNRKRAVFTLIDERPGIPAWQAKLIVLRRSMTARAPDQDPAEGTIGDAEPEPALDDTARVGRAPDEPPPATTRP